MQLDTKTSKPSYIYRYIVHIFLFKGLGLKVD